MTFPDDVCGTAQLLRQLRPANGATAKHNKSLPSVSSLCRVCERTTHTGTRTHHVASVAFFAWTVRITFASMVRFHLYLGVSEHSLSLHRGRLLESWAGAAPAHVFGVVCTQPTKRRAEGTHTAQPLPHRQSHHLKETPPPPPPPRTMLFLCVSLLHPPSHTHPHPPDAPAAEG